MEASARFYDDLADYYHLIFEDWNASISRQAKSLTGILERELGAAAEDCRILDCACGIGTQALGLAAAGFDVTGCDLSQGAVDRARREAAKRQLHIPLHAADMLDLSQFSGRDFDAVIALDNALPHLETQEQLADAAHQIRSCLRPGGVFLASIRDYDQLIRERPTSHGPAFYDDSGKRRIVFHVWDWVSPDRYNLHLHISLETENGFEAHHFVSQYRALLRVELDAALSTAGFRDIRWLMPEESGFYQPLVRAVAP